MGNISKKYVNVLSEDQYRDLVDHINKYDYFAFDTETTGLNTRKDKVIGFSLTGIIGEGYYFPLYKWNKETQQLDQVWDISNATYLLNMLKSKELIMANASFDIRMVKNNFKIDFTDNLIADVILMKHTVEEDGVFRLKDIAIQFQKEIGLDVERAANEEQLVLKENVKANGGSTTKGNFEMYKADLEILATYGAADSDLTLRLAEYFNARLENEGLLDFFYEKEVMPLYKKVTLKMEEKGIKLDLDVINKYYGEIKIKIEEYKTSIINQLSEIPEFVDWLVATVSDKYPISNKGNFAQEYIKFYNLDVPKSESGKYSITKKTLKTLPNIHLDFFNNLVVPSKVEAITIQKNLWVKSNEDVININSKLQLGDFVFNYLKIEPLSKTDGGSPQFDDSFIEHLSKMGYKWASTLSDYNKLIKLKSAYIERFLESHEDGYYYFYYKQHGTISGRYSSDAQQLPRPKDEGELSEDILYFTNAIRTFFISEENRLFADLDYESLEPYLFGDRSSEQSIRDIFKKGHDFYSTIAIMTEKLDYASADKKAENYLGKIDKPKRQKSKAYSLGLPYGLSPYALAMSLGIDKEEAEILHHNYFSAFPNLKKWIDESHEFVKSNGYIKTITGRVRHLPKVKEYYAKHGDNLLDFQYRKRLIFRYSNSLGAEEAKKKVVGMYLDYKNGLNNSINFQIQGLGASVVNLAMIKINKMFEKEGIDAWVCATVHDQIISNIPEQGAKEIASKIQYIMENVVKLSVDLKAPPALGRNWKDSH